MSNEQTYTENQIRQRLGRDLPHWRYEDGWIQRHFRTRDWKSTLMVVNTVGHLSEAAFHHPDLSVSYASVDIKLMTHSARGVTDKDFTLANKIEQVIQWQPGLEDGGSKGTSGEPVNAYIEYD